MMNERQELEEAQFAQKMVVRGLDIRRSRLDSEYRRASEELQIEITKANQKLRKIANELGKLVKAEVQGTQSGVYIWDDAFGSEKVANVYYSADDCPCEISEQVFELVIEFGTYIKMGSIAGRPK